MTLNMKIVNFIIYLLLVTMLGCSKSKTVQPSSSPKPDTLSVGWKLINLDTATFGGTDFTDIFFNNPTIGYAVGNGFWKSSNGGQTWVKMPSWQGINLAVTSNGTIFIVPIASGNGLYRSTDGGQSFSANNIPIPGEFNDIFFIGNDTGYISTDLGIIKTVDAGITWFSPTTTGLDIGSYYSSLFFFNDNLGWICDSSNVYKTNGNSNSWTKSTIHINTPFKYTSTIFPTSPNNIYLSVSNGEIYKSIDGGNNFYLRSLRFETEYPNWSDLHFVTDNIGYASYRKRIYKTNDGGLTWQVVVALGEKSISEIHFTDENHGWACGDDFILTYNP